MIYLDNAAYTRPLQHLKPIINKYFDTLANHQSTHQLGVYNQQLIDHAKEQVASAIHCEPDEVFFTRNATDGNRLMVDCDYTIKTISPYEHGGLSSCINLHISPLPDLHMFVNNETGKVFSKKTLYCCYGSDITSAIGNVDVDVADIGLLAAVGDSIKFGGIGGGFLYVYKPRQNVDILSHRGTENILNVICMGEAIEYATKNIDRKNEHCQMLKDTLLDGLTKNHVDFVCNSGSDCIPSIVSLTFNGISNEGLAAYLDSQDILISTGAACQSGSLEPSRVLKAFGLTNEQALSTVRISTCLDNTVEEINHTIDKITDYINMVK